MKETDYERLAYVGSEVAKLFDQSAETHLWLPILQALTDQELDQLEKAFAVAFADSDPACESR